MSGQQQIQLANGLTVWLIEKPHGQRAAALLQVAVGSQHEPDCQPGLAHLLEHLLFAGSDSFQEEERLMAWLPPRGGRLNASTMETATAFFFESDPDDLAAGLARLCDILVAPSLTTRAIRQEVATIDAEYRLLAEHPDTLCDAALSAAFCGPHPWQRFRVGNAAHFGQDDAALQRALRHFHQRYYHAGNCTLWLQGPQSLAVLQQLAQRYGGRFAPPGAPPPALPPLQFTAGRSLMLHQAGCERLRITFLLAGDPRAELSLLRQQLLDEASGSLMALLRARGLVDGVRLLALRQSDRQTVMVIEFMSGAGQAPAPVMAALWAWLRQLNELTPVQLQHAVQLMRRQFELQPPLEQLRQRAFGFSPQTATLNGWQQLLAQLQPQHSSRLWVTLQPGGQRRQVQGFSLALTAADIAGGDTPAGTERFAFFPRAQAVAEAALPTASVPLAHYPTTHQENAVLLLAPLTPLSPLWQQILLTSARTLVADSAHQGATLEMSDCQGLWLVQLQGPPAVMINTLAQLSACWQAPDAAVIARGEAAYRQQQQHQHQQQDILIRGLMAALPEALYPATQAALAEQQWTGCLYGGDKILHQHLARQLTRFPAQILPAPMHYPQPARAQSARIMSRHRDDSALLLFCPLAENSPHCLLAWQLLAALYQPHFFQQLRVEHNIGYAVSSRFYQVAGISGVLFALQSPHLAICQLQQRVGQFLAGMTTAIAGLSDDWLQQQCARLREEGCQQAGGLLACSQQHWLRQRYQMDRVSAALIDSVSVADLLGWHQRLMQQLELALGPGRLGC